MTDPEDTCRPVEVDGETIRVRGSGDMTPEAQEALEALVRVAKAKFIADAPEKVGELQNRLRLAHKARRAKEHQLDDIRRALCDVGLIEDDDPYSHADLADVIRQALRTESGYCPSCGRGDITPTADEYEQQRQRAETARATLDEVLRQFTHKGHPGEPCLQTGWISERTVARWRAALDESGPAATQATDTQEQP